MKTIKIKEDIRGIEDLIEENRITWSREGRVVYENRGDEDNKAPDRILYGTIRLTREAFEIIKSHPKVREITIKKEGYSLILMIETKRLYLKNNVEKLFGRETSLPLGEFRVEIQLYRVMGGRPYAKVTIKSGNTESGTCMLAYFQTDKEGVEVKTSICYGDDTPTGILREGGIFSLIENTIRLISLPRHEGGAPINSWKYSYPLYIQQLMSEAKLDERKKGIPKEIGILRRIELTWKEAEAIESYIEEDDDINYDDSILLRLVDDNGSED